MRGLDVQHRDELLAGLGELGRVFPDLIGGTHTSTTRPAGDAGVDRMRILDELAVLIGRLADERPVLFVLDDLHWADHATLLVIRHLLTFATPAPLMLVLTYRDTELDRRHPLSDLLVDLRRQGATTRINLEGLAVVHVEELLTMLSQHRVDAAGAEIARRVHAETDGNPFFVTEMMHHLIESGVVVEADGRWRVDVPLERIGLPEGVRDVVSRRLSALPAGCDDVLEVIAVVGREADLALVIDVAGLDEDLVVDTIDAAVHSGLLIEVPGHDRVAFCHAIVREVLHGELRGPSAEAA